MIQLKILIKQVSTLRGKKIEHAKSIFSFKIQISKLKNYNVKSDSNFQGVTLKTGI